jgi:glycosyltransferase involved in cell wall biosynthesis
LRVLYFIERFWPLIGGVEVISSDLVERLSERGHEIMVVTDQEGPWLPEDEMFGNVRVRRVPFMQAIRERDLEQLAVARQSMHALLRAYRPELIHVAFTGAGVWLLPVPSLAPVILSIHGAWPTIDFGEGSGLFGRVMNEASWVTACSQHTLGALLSSAPHVASKSSVVLNGLDAGFDGDPPEPPGGDPVLLCSGRIVEDKGIDIAIRALKQIIEDCPDVRLLVVGDGPARENLENQARSLGLTGNVQFSGWVSPSAMHELTARASVVLVPSRLEGFGLVALEAALMARPVIASHVGGLPEVVEDGVSGLLFDPDDPAALADAIKLLVTHSALARSMGRAGRRRALQRFSGARHVGEWDALYRRIGNGE